jgi:hypothetical protein
MNKDVCFNIAVIIVTLLAILMVFQHFNIKRERFSGTVIPGDLELNVGQQSNTTSIFSNINMPSESTLNTLAETANMAMSQENNIDSESIDSESIESENIESEIHTNPETNNTNILTNLLNQEVETFSSLSADERERSKLVPPGLNKNTIYGYTADALFIPNFDNINNFTL